MRCCAIRRRWTLWLQFACSHAMMAHGQMERWRSRPSRGPSHGHLTSRASSDDAQRTICLEIIWRTGSAGTVRSIFCLQTGHILLRCATQSLRQPEQKTCPSPHATTAFSSTPVQIAQCNDSSMGTRKSPRSKPILYEVILPKRQRCKQPNASTNAVGWSRFKMLLLCLKPSSCIDASACYSNRLIVVVNCEPAWSNV
eukprot:1980783-Pleurochrysis_carterae.AAC.4